jgi:hypothetical protein
MKPSNLFTLPRIFRSLLVAAFTLAASVAVQAGNFFDNMIVVGGTGGGTIDLGTASGSNLPGRYQWAIFALQGGVTITDPSLSGNPTDYDVRGNIGIAQNASLTLSNARIGGTVYLRNGAVPSTTNSVITGNGGVPLANQDAILNPAQASAYSAASAAAALARNTGAGASLLTISGAVPAGILNDDAASIVFANTGGGITGTANTTYVVNLANLVLQGTGAILTLTGANTTNYVINVTNYLSLRGGASIQLSGGLQPQNVLFNVRNSASYDVTMSGGSTLDGIILAANRNVKLTGGSVVTGEVIARGISLSGRSKVFNPVVSP